MPQERFPAIGNSPVWHPPRLSRPTTASASPLRRPASASSAADVAASLLPDGVTLESIVDVRMRDWKQRRECLPVHPAISPSSTRPGSAGLSTTLQSSWGGSPSSRPSTADGASSSSRIVASVVHDATQPSFSSVARHRRFDEPQPADCAAAILEERLRSAVDLPALVAEVDAALEGEMPPAVTLLDRYRGYRQRLLALTDRPTSSAIHTLLVHVFQQCDAAIQQLTRSAGTSEKETAAAAIRSAVQSSAVATGQVEQQQRQIDDLVLTLHHTVEVNDKLSSRVAASETALAELRHGVAVLCSTVGFTATADAVSTPHAVMMEGLKAAGCEVKRLRDEAVLMHQRTTEALSRHTEVSEQLTAALARAALTDTRDVRRQQAMRAMKQRTEGLEEHLSVAQATCASLAPVTLQARQLAASLAAASASADPLEYVIWETLRRKSSVDHEAFSPGGGPTRDHLDPKAVAASLKSMYTGSTIPPAHLKHALEYARMPLRHYDSPDALGVQLQAVFQLFEKQLSLSRTSHEDPTPHFDDVVLKYCKSNGGTETAVSLHVYAQRYARRSYQAYLFTCVADRRVAGETVVQLPRHMQALQEGLRRSAQGKKKDRLPRCDLLRYVRDAWPDVTDGELSALAQATITAALTDGVSKTTDDVLFDPFFDRSTPGAGMVHDTIVRIFVACIVRFTTRAVLAVAEERQKRRPPPAGADESERNDAPVPPTHAGPMSTVTLAEVDAALLKVDPECPKETRLRRVAVAAGVSAAAASGVGASDVELAQVEERWRGQCLLLPFTPYSPAAAS